MDPNAPERHLYFIEGRALRVEENGQAEKRVPEPACRRMMNRSGLQRRDYPAKLLFPLLAREEFADPLPRSGPCIGDEGP